MKVDQECKHLDRKKVAHGLCNPCYVTWYRKQKARKEAGLAPKNQGRPTPKKLQLQYDMAAELMHKGLEKDENLSFADAVEAAGLPRRIAYGGLHKAMITHPRLFQTILKYNKKHREEVAAQLQLRSRDDKIKYIEGQLLVVSEYGEPRKGMLEALKLLAQMHGAFTEAAPLITIANLPAEWVERWSQPLSEEERKLLIEPATEDTG